MANDGGNNGFDGGGLYNPTYSANQTGLTTNDHAHAFSGTTGNISEGHNHPITAEGSSATNANLQPYVVVYMWNRTA
jgi:hypothetical protein